jgi:hypothetical protein
MTDHGHFIAVYECGHVHSQCRCATSPKVESKIPGLCPECLKTQQKPREVHRVYMVTPMYWRCSCGATFSGQSYAESHAARPPE